MTLTNSFELSELKYKIYHNCSTTLIEDVDLYYYLKLNRTVLNIAIQAINLFGILSNLVSLYIFSRKKHFEHELYRYLYVHTFVSLIFLIFCLSNMVIKSDYVVNRVENNYHLKLFELVSNFFLNRTFTTLMVFIECIISIKRLLMIYNLNLTINLKLYKVIAIYFGVSVLFCLPLPLTFEIRQLSATKESNSTRTLYDLTSNYYGMSKTLKALVLFPGIIRGIFLPVALVISNAIIFYDYRKSLSRYRGKKRISKDTSASVKRSSSINKKSQPSNESNTYFLDFNKNAVKVICDSKKHLTRFVISFNFLYIFSNLLTSIVVISIIILGYSSKLTRIIIFMHASLFFLTHSVSIIFYYIFDLTFKKTLNLYAKKYFSFLK